ERESLHPRQLRTEALVLIAAFAFDRMRAVRGWTALALILAALLAGCTVVSPTPGPPAARSSGPGGGIAVPSREAPVAGAAEPLPIDPSLVTGTLESGLRYMVTRHPNPAGRAAFWLHVGAGSLDEKEETRGLAHYLEHMAFNGSTNFSPGTLLPYFESIGLSFGRDQNAFTGLDQTVYQIALPSVQPEILSKALLFLGDVARRLTLLPEEIDG